MKLPNYAQPEHPQPTELERKVRGARLECERLDLQVESSITRLKNMVKPESQGPNEKTTTTLSVLHDRT